MSSTNGTVSGPDGSGNYTFTPNDDYNGIANFNYLISDGQGGSISNSVNLTIDPVNDQPIATFTISQYSTESTAVLNGQLTATDIDVTRGEAANTSLVYSIDGAAIDGLTINADGSFSFDPTHPSYNYLALNQQLVITVPYKVTDGGSLSGSNSFTLTVTGSNDTPVAQAGLQITLTNAFEDTNYTVDVDDLLQGYTDPDTNDTLTVQSLAAYKIDASNLVTSELAGSFVAVEVGGVLDSFIFTPLSDYNGNISLSYKVTDGNGVSVDATASLSINSVNDTPVATFSTNQVASEGGDVVLGQLTATDTEIIYGEQPTTSLTYSLVGDAIPGLTINPDGSFSFDPSNLAYDSLPVGEEQLISVTYRVSDAGLLTSDKTFTISVKGTNDDPIVDVDLTTNLAAGTEDTTYFVSLDQLLSGYTDPDSTDLLSVEGINVYKADANGQPLAEVAGSVTATVVNDSSGYNYKPIDDFNGNVVFTYTVSDSNGPGIQASLDLVINPVEDIPRLRNLGSEGLNLGSINEDTFLQFDVDNLLEGYSDPEGLVLSVKDVSVSPLYGTITNVGDNFTFIPKDNFSGPVQIDFTVVDQAGNEVLTSKYVNVEEVNDLPTIVLDRETVDEDFKSKTYSVPLDDIFDNVPDDLSFEILNNTPPVVFAEIRDNNLVIDIPAAYLDDVIF